MEVPAEFNQMALSRHGKPAKVRDIAKKNQAGLWVGDVREAGAIGVVVFGWRWKRMQALAA